MSEATELCRRICGCGRFEGLMKILFLAFTSLLIGCLFLVSCATAAIARDVPVS